MAVFQQQFEQAMGDAVRAFNDGRLDLAANLCKGMLQSRLNDPAVHQLLALVCLQQQKLADAHGHIGCSLQARPEHAPSLLVAGRIALFLQETDAALGYFEKAALLAPQDPEPLYRMGSALAGQGKLASATEWFIRWVQLHPSHASAWCGLGTVLQQAGIQDRAEFALERALALDSRQAEAWFHLGLLRQDKTDLQGAAEAFRAALHIQPDFAEAAVNLGIVLQENARVDEALAAYRRAYQLRSNTFGRITNALASRPHGRMWINLDQLRALLAV
jgi:tetratricopeptide (TPR) repeat protein